MANVFAGHITLKDGTVAYYSDDALQTAIFNKVEHGASKDAPFPFTAAFAYQEGGFICLDGSFYTANAAIEVGDTVASTDVTASNIAAFINSLIAAQIEAAKANHFKIITAITNTSVTLEGESSPSDPEAGVIYLLKDASATGHNVYTEYIFVDMGEVTQHYETLGPLEMDLSNYVTITLANSIIGSDGVEGDPTQAASAHSEGDVIFAEVSGVWGLYELTADTIVGADITASLSATNIFAQVVRKITYTAATRGLVVS